MEVKFDLTEEQIRLIKSNSSLDAVFNCIREYMKDYYYSCKDTMHPKRKKNVVCLANNSIAYAKAVESLICSLKEQLNKGE